MTPPELYNDSSNFWTRIVNGQPKQAIHINVFTKDKALAGQDESM